MNNLITELEKVTKEKNQFGFLNLIDTESVLNLINGEILKRTSKSLYKMLDDIPLPVFWKDSEGKFLGANRAMLDIFGIKKREELIGQTDAYVLKGESLLKIQETDKSVIQTGTEVTLEESAMMPKTGELHFFITVKMALRNDEGEIIGLFGYSLEVTEIKKAKQKLLETEEKESQSRKLALEAKEKALAVEQQNIELKKQELAEREKRIKAEEDREAATLSAGALAHDMKNRLTPFTMQVEFLQIINQEIKPRIQHYLTPQEANILFGIPDKLAANLKGLVQEITEIDQYNKDMLLGSEELVQKYNKIQDIGKCLQEVAHLYEDRGNIIKINNKNNFQFMGNYFAGFRVVTNLMNNSLRKVDEKGGEIFIETDSQGKFNILKVRDTAGGVDKKLITNIFNRYKQGKVQGTGLGLSAAKMWMKKMKGKLMVDLVDGDKIEFKLLFPKIK
jgi:PAS domain S-box-containing protein